MELSTIKKGDFVKISARLTGMGVMDGVVTNIEPFFDKPLITARYLGESMFRAHPRKEVQGFEDSFAKMEEKEAREKGYIIVNDKSRE